MKINQLITNKENIIDLLGMDDEVNLIQNKDPILRRLKRAILRNLQVVEVLNLLLDRKK